MKNKKTYKKQRKKRNTKQYSPEELLQLVDTYIEEKGFIIDAKSFGQAGSKKTGTYPVANEYKYFIIVSARGFMLWLDKHKNYMHELLNKLEPDIKKDILTRVHQKLYVHNSSGNSIGHINNNVFNMWIKQTFERDEIEFSKELKKLKIEQEKIKLDELKKLSDKNSGDDFDVNNFDMISKMMKD